MVQFVAAFSTCPRRLVPVKCHVVRGFVIFVLMILRPVNTYPPVFSIVTEFSYSDYLHRIFTAPASTTGPLTSIERWIGAEVGD